MLDLISRDQADVATLFKQLKFAGVTIVTLAVDEITELHVGLKGTMNALFLKDPSTGKRVSRPNPEAAWIRTIVPHLRIVDDALWNAVRARQKQIAEIFGPKPG